MKKKIVFKITDKLGNLTILDSGCITHIYLRHPNVLLYTEQVKNTLIYPSIILKDKFGAFLFYRKLHNSIKTILSGNYMAVCTKQEKNSKNRFVATYYTVLKPKSGGTIIYEDKNQNI